MNDTSTSSIPKVLRVAVWGTGWVGSIAIRSIHRHDDLELVAVRVYDPAKVGRDAGELAAGDLTGVLATDDPAAVFAARPDCIVYAGDPGGQAATIVDDVALILAAGINVVTTSMSGLVYPPAWDPTALAQLEAAARSGGTTVYASGIEPGFAADQLPLTLLTMSDQIQSVRTQEIFRYDRLINPFTAFDVFGFGRAVDQQCLMEMSGVQAMTWGPPVRMVADALGWTLARLDETYEKVVTDRRLDVAAGTIPGGTVGAVRFETIGVVDGRPAIVIEHVNRMADDLAPDWPNADRDGTYRIVIDGAPSMTCTLTMGDEATASDEGMVATTMRIVNAIRAVVEAPPGVVSSRDLPLTLPTQA